MRLTFRPKGEELASRIRELGGHRVLVRMARAGQILELACEMPKCYYQGGRKKFLPKSGIRKWQLSMDHHPTLKRDKGKLVPWNVRMGHVFCNNEDLDGGRGSTLYSRRASPSKRGRVPSSGGL